MEQLEKRSIISTVSHKLAQLLFRPSVFFKETKGKARLSVLILIFLGEAVSLSSAYIAIWGNIQVTGPTQFVEWVHLLMVYNYVAFIIISMFTTLIVWLIVFVTNWIMLRILGTKTKFGKLLIVGYGFFPMIIGNLLVTLFYYFSTPNVIITDTVTQSELTQIFSTLLNQNMFFIGSILNTVFILWIGVLNFKALKDGLGVSSNKSLVAAASAISVLIVILWMSKLSGF
ncbi:MAG: YIP1 family protein [Candidatus Odinarchaeia archaeon]